MKTSELRLGDVVRYNHLENRHHFYMDMTVVKVEETVRIIHRPYISIEDGVPILKVEPLWFPIHSTMEWKLLSKGSGI